MSPRRRRSSSAQHHVEWLQLLDVSGPFLSLSVLSDVFPQGLDAVEPELAERLKQAHAEWLANRELRRPDPAIHTTFLDFVLREVLGYPDEVIADSQELGDAYTATLPEHRVTLRPDLAIRRPGEPPTLLVTRHPAQVSLTKPLDERGLHASPVERMRLLLKHTGVRSGLVTNGSEWTLVHVPADRTATFVTWSASLLVEERVLLRSFVSLLGTRRLFGVDDPETLDGLFERSRDDEREVTDQLGYQARRAVELLVAAFDRADHEASGGVLRDVPEHRLYEASLAVVMRVIFLLAAEARGLFPDDGPWAESYALTPLRSELEAQADRHGLEVLERRFDAWPRLLATFRAVHGGIEHSRVRMPGYGGGLFDPERYPFLEGDGGAVPSISNRAVLHVLDALQTLEVEVPGGRERRPLSFRALAIEQIGHVYEGLLDHTAIRADAPALGLVGTKRKEPEVALAELEAKRKEGEDALLAFLREETGRSVSALRRALGAELDPERLARLRAACGHDAELVERALPFAGLVRDDVYGDPMVFREGHVYVTQSPFRRSTGTHYTPPSLTEPIVQYALEPVVYRGPADGRPREEWELKRPSELLALKVCDIAMGSAAFLVAACRYLAARLVEAWEQHPEEAPADVGSDLEERDLTARRLVAERCLYGVDVNPLAVEIAKVSLWLTTLRRDRPFTFLDHALRCGDSLLGLTSLEQLEALSLKPEEAGSVLLEPAREAIRSTLAEVQAVRERIEATDAVDLREAEQKATALAGAERKLHALKVVGDLVVGAALEEAAGKGKARTTVEAAAEEIREALEADDDDRRAALLARVEARAGDALMAGRAPRATDPPRPFHWVLEFPEVFQRENGGFDAIVGNPPFLGGQRITGLLGEHYREYLVLSLADGQRGSADLVAYFFRRASALAARSGSFGLLATNTISQGDTRMVGLGHLVGQGWRIFRAVKSAQWPGEAGVVVSHVWASRVWDAPPRFTSSLDLVGRVEGDPRSLAANHGLASIGTYVLGLGFVLDPEESQSMTDEDPRLREVIQPYLVAEDLMSRPGHSASRHVINFQDWPEERAREYGLCWQRVAERVRPHRAGNKERHRREEWWQFARPVLELYRALGGASRVLVGPRVAKYWCVVWVPPRQVYDIQLIVFTFGDDGRAAVLSSIFHDAWARKTSGTLGEGLRYSPTDCFQNFPFPEDVSVLDRIGDRYLTYRKETLLAEQQGLTKVYNRVHEQPEDTSERIEELRRLRRELDRAVADAYGWTDLELDHDFRETPLGLRYTISEAVKTEVLDRLLELNHARYAEEVAQGLQAKGAKKKRGGARKSRRAAGQLEL
ncbi:MAG TPA: DNA methyltransferase [Gaiellaceae bacterium]|nr:DNA methyltransferase [Gaiellaceae bacterium]